MFNGSNDFTMPVMPAAYGGNDGMLGNNGWWVIILFALIFGYGGNGFNSGNNAVQNTATQADIMRGFDNQTVVGKLDRLGDGISSLGYDQLSQMNSLQRDLCTGFTSLASAVDNARFDAKNCCCETNRNIDSVRYENAQNTCAITNAIHSEGEMTRALINANTMQDLRDQLADAKLANSQCAQNAYLVNTIRPYPVQAVPFANFGDFNGCC